jgi:hypothetical protein
MIDTMGAARRLASARLAAIVVCAGGMLLAAPAVGLAAGWSPTTETVGGSSGATEVASSFDASTSLSAIWPGSSAVESAVRTTSWPASATTVGGGSGATSPDLAIGGGTSLAVWIDSGNNLNVSVRSGVGAWSAPSSLSAGVASSPQAAIVSGNPTVFWLDSGAVESATLSGGLWSAAATPAGAPAGPISGLRVSVDSTGSGIAAWVDGLNVDTAVINAGAWTVDAGSLSTSADTSTTVAVAAQGSIQAVAWSEPTNGVQVAVSTGAGLAVEPGAKNAAADHPALYFDSTGRLFAAYLNGPTVTAEIRSTSGTWGAETTLGTGAAVAPSVAADASGDVAVTWVGVSALQMRAFDATPSDVTINPPASLSPGTHTWSVTTSDLWSPSGGSTTWSFSDGGTATGDSVMHADLTPGSVTATATRDDGVGNITIVHKTVTIAPVAPTNSAVPSISAGGSLVSGTQLTAGSGTWSGNPTPSLTEEWQRCDSSSCTAIPSATGSTYTLTATDAGFKIRLEETASNSGGSAIADSAKTAVVEPVATGQPTLTPSASPIADGVTLTANTDPSDWGGATNLSFTYRFERCNGSCTIVQETGSNAYTLSSADVGSTIQVSVVARGGPVDGDLSAPAMTTSLQTVAVAPKATGAPSVTGAAQDGQLLTASSPASDWDGVANLTQTYQFYRCDANGGGCAAVDAVSSSPTYTLSWDDIGSTIKVVAFASKGGSTVISSSSSAATSIIRPTLTAAPAAPTGGAQDGQQLTAATGTWLNQAHLSFKYEYFRCSPSCASLGAPSASATYVLQPGDVGNTIQVAVTAYIGSGTTLATSSNTLAIAPLNTGVSSITAPAQQQDGQTYTASDGAWNGATGLAFGYQWKRCDSTGNTCTAIQGAISKTYASGPLDVGQTLRAIVSASKGGSAKTLATGDSAQTGVVAPRNTVLPSTSGTPMDGQVLTADAAGAGAGSWDGVANLTFAYQWLRCDGSGNSCVAITTNGTGSTYTLTPDDVAAPGDATHARITIRVQISATINGAATAANSNATPQIAAAPTVNTTLPAVSGDPIENQELTASAGAWSGTDVHVVSYQWVRCDPPFAACTNDGVASLSGRYIVQTADVGHYVTFVETVANRLGATSTQRAVVGKPVVSNVLGATDAPLVTPPTYVDGTVLSTSDGVWLPADHLTFTYQWLRCPGSIDTTADDSSSCPWIPSASSSTYTLTPADVGSYVVSLVKATYTQDGVEVTHAFQPSSLEGLPLVTARPPVNSTRPTIAGTASQDATLTASPGVWGGTNTAAAPITFAYQWLRCDTSGGACVAVPGATKSTFAPTAADVGSTLVVRVTGTNSGGSSSASSDATAVVTGLAAASTSGGGQVPSGTPAGGSSGPGGGTHAASVKSDKTKPVLTIAFVGGGTLAGGTTLSVNATCPKTETSCKAVFHLLAKLKKPTGKAVSKPVTIASASTTLARGQRKLLKLKLSSAARSALRKALKLKVTLAVSVTDAAGNITPNETKGFTLRWKKS